MGRLPLSAGFAAVVALAQPAAGFEDWTVREQPPWRNQGGTLNYAPRPDVYLVLAVDDYYDTLTLRSRTGAEVTVHVDERIYDISKLRPGDLIKVDFFVDDEPEDRLSVGRIWELR